jgi:hypothetical protein
MAGNTPGEGAWPASRGARSRRPSAGRPLAAEGLSDSTAHAVPCSPSGRAGPVGPLAVAGVWPGQQHAGRSGVSEPRRHIALIRVIGARAADRRAEPARRRAADAPPAAAAAAPPPPPRRRFPPPAVRATVRLLPAALAPACPELLVDFLLEVFEEADARVVDTSRWGASTRARAADDPRPGAPVCAAAGQRDSMIAFPKRPHRRCACRAAVQARRRGCGRSAGGRARRRARRRGGAGGGGRAGRRRLGGRGRRGRGQVGG